jgi:hypothetical protein
MSPLPVRRAVRRRKRVIELEVWARLARTRPHPPAGLWLLGVSGSFVPHPSADSCKARPEAAESGGKSAKFRRLRSVAATVDRRKACKTVADGRGARRRPSLCAGAGTLRGRLDPRRAGSDQPGARPRRSGARRAGTQTPACDPRAVASSHALARAPGSGTAARACQGFDRAGSAASDASAAAIARTRPARIRGRSRFRRLPHARGCRTHRPDASGRRADNGCTDDGRCAAAEAADTDEGTISAKRPQDGRPAHTRPRSGIRTGRRSRGRRTSSESRRASTAQA